MWVRRTCTHVYIRPSPCTPISGSVSSPRVAISIRDLTCERDFFNLAHSAFSSSGDPIAPTLMHFRKISWHQRSTRRSTARHYKIFSDRFRRVCVSSRSSFRKNFAMAVASRRKNMALQIKFGYEEI